MKKGSYLIDKLFTGDKEAYIKNEINRLYCVAYADEKNICECLKCLEFSKEKTLLDVGCGPGSSTFVAHNFCKEGFVTGTDREKEYIEYAQNRIKDLGIENVRFIQRDSESLCYDGDEQFDICFSRYLFQHLTKPDLAFKELIRMTKKGGKIGIYEEDWGLTSIFPEPRHYDKFIKAKLTLNRFSGGDIYYGRKLYSLFKRHNLQNVKVTRLYRDIDCPGREAISDSLRWLYRYGENHPFVKSKLITAQELQEFGEDIQRIATSPEGFVSFGSYFVYGEKY